jgi:hypothetical protein
MSSELERFNQGLQDLIFIREKLNAELNGELARSDKLAKAVSDLQRLNDAAQNVIENTLYRIGVWHDPDSAAEPPPLPDIKMPNIARQKPLPSENFSDQLLKQVNGSRVN